MSIHVPLRVYREYDGRPLELHIARISWRTRMMRLGQPRLGDDMSRKLSVKLQFAPRDIWIGLCWQCDGHHSWTWHLAIIPCIRLRIKLKSSSAGIFP